MRDRRGGERLPDISVLPEYFDDLVDLLERLGRRRDVAAEALRCLEFTGVETLAADGATWREAFPSASPLAVKVASDVVRFVVRTSGLPAEFISRFDVATRPPAASTRHERPPGLFYAPAVVADGADDADTK